MNYLYVAVGGAIGSALRYFMGSLMLPHSVHMKFPLSTFLVNVTGCFLIGLLGGGIVKHNFLVPELRLFLITGILGGYTTFSAFSLEGFYLIRNGEVGLAFFYVLASVIVGFLALFLAFQAVPKSFS